MNFLKLTKTAIQPNEKRASKMPAFLALAGFLFCGMSGGISLRLYGASNDAFDNSIPLEGSPLTLQASNAGATREAGEPRHGGEGGASVWWLWHPPDDGYAVVDTQGSSFDTLLAVYFGKGFEKLDLIAAHNGSTNGIKSRVVFPATSKREYAIAVDGMLGATGAIALQLTLYTQPVILTQPSSQEITSGADVEFSVDVLDLGAHAYQWQFQGVDLPGETNSTLTLKVATRLQIGSYRVLVSNRFGSVASHNAELTVLGQPRIVQQPEDGQQEAGKSVSFTVQVLGEAPLRYQWFYGDQILPDQNGPILTLPRVFPELAGLYYVFVSNDFGAITSDPARLTVPPPPPLQPPVIRGWGGDPAGGDFLVGGGGCRTEAFPLEVESRAPVVFQWEFNIKMVVDGVATNWLGVIPTSEEAWVPIPGATNSTLVLTNITIAHSGAIRLVASNRAGVTVGSPGRLAVTMRPLIDSQSEDQTILMCDPAVLQVQVEDHCVPYTCQWFFENGPLPGATNLDLALPRVELRHAGRYRAVIRNVYGVVSSRTILLTVDPRPQIVEQPQAPVAPLHDGDLFLLSVLVKESCWPVAYQWTRNSIPLEGETNAELALAITPLTAAAYRVKVANAMSVVTSSPALLRVRPEPLILEHPDSQGRVRVPIGGSAILRIRAQSSSALQFQWRHHETGLVLDANHQIMTNGFLLLTNATLRDAGPYDVVVRSATGQSVSRPVQVDVLPPPSNDLFSERISISGTPVLVAGSNVVATAEPDEPRHAGQPASHSVWWTWTAPFPCEVTLNLGECDYEALVGVYQGGSLQDLIPVEVESVSVSNSMHRVTFLAARGKTFQIAVDGYEGAQGSISMKLEAREIIAPPVIVEQPLDTAAVLGGDSRLTIVAQGSPDIRYQWFFNERPLVDQTNRILELKAIQSSSLGEYSVSLQNDFGFTNSRTARLTLGAVIRGQVTDATNRRGIPNAKVTVGPLSTYTDANGFYLLVGATPGAANADFDSDKRLLRLNERVRFINQSVLDSSALHGEKRPDYYDYYDPLFEARPGQNVTHHFSMSPRIEGFRFVVNWAEQPADLDAHLLTPAINGVGYHVQYLLRDRGRSDAPPYATLDYDVTDGYGPETVTISRLVDGIYQFYVKQYDSQAPGALASSGAVIKLYNRDGLFGIRQAPSLGEGTVWHVCDIDGRRNAVTWINQLLPSEPAAASPLVPASRVAPSVSARKVAESMTETIQPPGHDRPFGQARFLWDFGDGSLSADFEPAHAYEAPGLYTVTLRLFAQGDTNALTALETKTEFITVYNESPEVSLLSIVKGQLFRAGDPIPLQAHAVDTDGRIVRVDFFIIENGITNQLGTRLTPPYRLEYTNAPIGEYAFLVQATDNFNAVALSETIPVRVLDLDGDVLIVRNFADEEITAMAAALETITLPTPDGAIRNLTTRILDQEGLRFDLVRDFKLIVWNDQGQLNPGLTDNDVAVFEQARNRGIALYLMGDRLGGSGALLGNSTRPLWTQLVQFLPPSSQVPGGVIQLLRNRPRHEFFNQRFGRVEDFVYEEIRVEASPLSSGEGEVVATLQERPVMLRFPAFTEPDFGQSRRVAQAFRIFSGSDETSRVEREKLFLNAAGWLLRLTDCSSIGGFVEPVDTPASARLGQPLTLSARVTQNGECTIGGVLLTNLFAPGFEVQTCEILPLSELADPSTVRYEIDDNRVIVRFSQLGSASGFLLKMTGIPRMPGQVSVTHSLHIGLVDREPAHQVVPVEAVVSEQVTLTSHLGPKGEISLHITGTPGSYVEIQESQDLINWGTRNHVVITQPLETFEIGAAAENRKFFRIKTR